MTSNYVFNRPAPRGELWALEASAGTGKTWTIENFVADYLADPSIEPEDIVIVTFTKAATAELRARIRSNIVAITRGFDSHLPHRNYTPTERARLRAVLSAYSNIRISTIHGFAQRTLATLGEPVNERSIILEDDDFVTSVLSDAIRSMPEESLIALQANQPYMEHAVGALKALLNNPAATIRTPSVDSYDIALVELLTTARVLINDRKVKHGLLSMGDLLSKVHALLERPDNARLIAQSMRVLLIDEFQDTDSLQWDIFRRIYACGTLTAFVVVGDPKQAIYGFRGGDVQVYREAVDPTTAMVLNGNRRSSGAFVAAMNEYFEDTDFGLTFSGADGHATLPDGSVVSRAEIAYHKIEALGSLSNVSEGPGWVFRKSEGTDATARKEQVTDDMPRYIAGLLNTVIPDPKTGISRPVALNDICILTKTNALNQAMNRSLLAAGVPVTLYGGANVFSSDAATQWRHLLFALQNPSRTSSICLFAWTWFGGASTAELLDHRDDEQWLAPFHQRLIDLHQRFMHVRRSDFFNYVFQSTGVLEFLATMSNSQRLITDSHHIAEILRTRENSSLSQLVDFLDRASTSDDDEELDADIEGGEWSRRIDGDTQSVQIMTIHKAKGLEFPIVLIPYVTNHPGRERRYVVYRSYQNGEGATYLEINPSVDKTVKDIYDKQRKSEVRRMAYVAMTRAQVRNIIWTFVANALNDPVLHNQDWHREHIESSDAFAWDTVELTTPKFRAHEDGNREVATFTSALTTPPRRHSYSSIADNFGTAQSVDTIDYEPLGDEEGAATPQAPSLEIFTKLRGSARLGKAVHKVLELCLTDTAAVTVSERVRAACRDEGVRTTEQDPMGVDLDSVSALVENALTGDLGTLAPTKRLADFAQGRTIVEMNFDFTLPSPVSTDAVIDVLRTYLSDDPLYGPWVRSARVSSIELAGFVTGSIDAVLVDGTQDEPTFAIVDYKTNRISADDTYGAMLRAMHDHHYFLQSLVYLVALHRYLRSRLGSDYDYHRHVRGAGYLFLRAMSSDIPGAGIIYLTPSPACIEALSDLFDGSQR